MTAVPERSLSPSIETDPSAPKAVPGHVWNQRYLKAARSTEAFPCPMCTSLDSAKIPNFAGARILASKPVAVSRVQYRSSRWTSTNQDHKLQVNSRVQICAVRTCKMKLEAKEEMQVCYIVHLLDRRVVSRLQHTVDCRASTLWMLLCKQEGKGLQFPLKCFIPVSTLIAYHASSSSSSSVSNPVVKTLPGSEIIHEKQRDRSPKHLRCWASSCTVGRWSGFCFQRPYRWFLSAALPKTVTFNLKAEQTRWLSAFLTTSLQFALPGCFIFQSLLLTFRIRLE